MHYTPFNWNTCKLQLYFVRILEMFWGFFTEPKAVEEKQLLTRSFFFPSALTHYFLSTDMCEARTEESITHAQTNDQGSLIGRVLLSLWPPFFWPALAQECTHLELADPASRYQTCFHSLCFPTLILKQRVWRERRSFPDVFLGNRSQQTSWVLSQCKELSIETGANNKTNWGWARSPSIQLTHSLLIKCNHVLCVFPLPGVSAFSSGNWWEFILCVRSKGHVYGGFWESLVNKEFSDQLRIQYFSLTRAVFHGLCDTFAPVVAPRLSSSGESVLCMCGGKNVFLLYCCVTYRYIHK